MDESTHPNDTRPNRFRSYMTERTDAQLIEIVTLKRGDYDSEAVLAAEQEILRRNITPEQQQQGLRGLEAKIVATIARAELPLPTVWKVLAFLFPNLILNILIAYIIKVDGYERRFREVVRWTLYGFATYVGFGLLISLSEALSS